MQGYPVRNPGPFKALLDQILEFVIDLNAVDMASLRKSECQADGGVARESAYFQHIGRPHHP